MNSRTWGRRNTGPPNTISKQNLPKGKPSSGALVTSAKTLTPYKVTFWVGIFWRATIQPSKVLRE